MVHKFMIPENVACWVMVTDASPEDRKACEVRVVNRSAVVMLGEGLPSSRWARGEKETEEELIAAGLARRGCQGLQVVDDKVGSTKERLVMFWEKGGDPLRNDRKTSEEKKR